MSSLTEDKASFGKLSETYESLMACWHVWFVLLSTLAFLSSWRLCLLRLFFPEVPLVFCSCLENGLFTGQRFLQRRFHIFDFFTKLHAAFCESPNYVFFPRIMNSYFCRLPLCHAAALAAGVPLRAGTSYIAKLSVSRSTSF